MALARSASGPAGLSINTSSANTVFGSGAAPPAGGMFGSTQASKPGGLFGATTAAPQSGGLFGSTTSSAPAATGLFGSTTTQPASGGLFGSTAPAQPASGGLFGSTAPSQPAAGGLFGSTATTQAANGGLFGSVAPTQQTGGLFGSTQPAATQQASGGLFGAAAVSTPAAGGGLFGSNPAPSGGLFGGLNQQQNQTQQTQNQPASNSFFGSLGQSTQNQQPQPQQQSSMFGQTQGGGLGGLGGRNVGIGQQNQQPQQVVPGVRIDMANIRGTTRFNDLHDDLQKEITNIDSFIQRQIQLSQECRAIMPSHESQLMQVPNDYEFCRRKMIGLDNGQDSDIQSIAQAAQLVKSDAENALLSFRAIDNLKLPPQYHNSGMWSNQSTNDGSSTTRGEAQDIVGFFSKTADDLRGTLDKYQGHVTEIEQHLRGVEAASAQQINALVARQHGSSRTQVDPVEDLAAVLREFEQSLLGVAGRVGGAREAVQSAQVDGFASTSNGWASTNGGGANGARRGIY